MVVAMNSTRVLITCNCRACNGLQAEITSDTAAKMGREGTKKHAGYVHTYVQMAHSPLASATQVATNGPWAV